MQTRSSSLFVISLTVGAFGALTGRLFTGLLLPQSGFDFGLPPFAYAWISPLVLFVSATATFAWAFGFLPATRGRARRAGWVAAVLTYLCHAAWIAAYAGVARNAPVVTVFMTLLVMFIVIGWVPILSGIFAGWCVERWLGRPRDETERVDRREGTLAAAAIEFGLVGALISVPLIFIVYTMARRSRVDFPIFFPSAPVVVFGLAAAAFWLCCSLLPPRPLSMTMRGRIAGAVAALAAFSGFLFWTRYAVNIRTRDGLPYGSWSEPFSIVFLLAGWIPAVFGVLTGGWAVRRLEIPDAGA